MLQDMPLNIGLYFNTKAKVSSALLKNRDVLSLFYETIMNAKLYIELREWNIGKL